LLKFHLFQIGLAILFSLTLTLKEKDFILSDFILKICIFLILINFFY